MTATWKPRTDWLHESGRTTAPWPRGERRRWRVSAGSLAVLVLVACTGSVSRAIPQPDISIDVLMWPNRLTTRTTRWPGMSVRDAFLLAQGDHATWAPQLESVWIARQDGGCTTLPADRTTAVATANPSELDLGDAITVEFRTRDPIRHEKVLYLGYPGPGPSIVAVEEARTLRALPRPFQERLRSPGGTLVMLRLSQDEAAGCQWTVFKILKTPVADTDMALELRAFDGLALVPRSHPGPLMFGESSRTTTMVGRVDARQIPYNEMLFFVGSVVVQHRGEHWSLPENRPGCDWTDETSHCFARPGDVVFLAPRLAECSRTQTRNNSGATVQGEGR